MINYEMMDRSKDYGTVYGSSNFMYEQDGKFFNAQFQRVDSDGMIIEITQPLTKRAIPIDAKEELETDTPKIDETVKEKVIISGTVSQNQKNTMGQQERKKIVLPKRVANT